MLTPEEHATRLRSCEVDQLLELMTLEAKRLHDGHYTIFSFSTHFKVAFDTPDVSPYSTGQAYAQLAEMPGFPTLKEALIAALLSAKTFTDFFDGDPEEWWEAGMQELKKRLPMWED
jgi:hypothetical protein